MKVLIAVGVLLVALPCFAATAMWTGRAEMVTTVTYQQAWRCEYRYQGTIFYRLFPTMSCPSFIEVQ